MAQTQIELTDAQMTALEKLAKEQNTTPTQLIQDSIQKLIEKPANPYTSKQKERALAIVGKFESDLSDLSTNHDTYFVETIQP